MIIISQSLGLYLTILCICLFAYSSSAEPINPSNIDKTLSVEISKVNSTVKPNKKIGSYGKWQKSIMFANNDMKKMKAILDIYEKNIPASEYDMGLYDSLNAIKVDGIVNVDGEEVKQIKEYPIFHLKSIAYKSKRDWSLWINNIKITNHNNRSNKYEVKIIKLDKGKAYFSWLPKDEEYIKYFAAKHSGLIKLAKSTAKERTNRFGRPPARPILNNDKTAIYFSLRLNQSFSAEKFETYEGNFRNAILTELEIPFDGLVTVPTTVDGIDGSKENGNLAAKSDDEASITENTKKFILDSLGIEK